MSISIITHYWTLSEYHGPARHLPVKPAHNIHLMSFNRYWLRDDLSLELYASTIPITMFEDLHQKIRMKLLLEITDVWQSCLVGHVQRWARDYIFVCNLFGRSVTKCRKFLKYSYKIWNCSTFTLLWYCSTFTLLWYQHYINGKFRQNGLHMLHICNFCT